MPVEHNRKRQRPAGAAGIVLSAATVALLAGCSASPGTLAKQSDPTLGSETEGWVWTDDAGLDPDAPDTSLAALAARAAAEIEALQGDPTQSGDVVVLDPPAPPARQRKPVEPEPLREAIAQATEGTTASENSSVHPDEGMKLTVEPIPEPTRGMRIAEHAAELARLLKEEALESSDPARPLVAAALLESAASGVIDEIDLPGGGPLMLTEEERSALTTIRELAVRLAGQDTEIGGDPQRIREVLLASAEGLREHARVRIGKAELCTRAPGFGNYEPVPRRTFLAGRTNRVVVYAEIEHFALRSATTGEAMSAGDTVAAELTQELELFLREGDAKPTWVRRIEWLPRTSRRSFADLFLAQMIELPATLAVGAYDLKVRVIDEVTGAQDETVIPIRLVADASALEEEADGEDETPVSGNLVSPIARSNP